MANPTASGVTVTKAAGASTPLSALFAYFDADNDIVSFAIKDREIGGGYLTFNGNMQPENVLIDFIPIAQIGQWAFVAGPAGSTSTIGFNANDSMGGFNPSAVSTVNVAAVAAPHDPTATGVTVSKAAGQSTPLSSLFAYSDLDNDIVEFAVKDREVGGGYLTFNSTPQTANILIDHIPISQIGQWAFVAGPAGSTSTIGFNAIDSRGAFNPSAVSTVNVGSLTSNAILLAHYPVFGVEQIAQGNRDTDDSHITSSALQWGYDFLAASKPVLSVAGGTVVAVKSDLAGSFVGYGNVVTVLHDGGFYATYAHLAFNSVNVTVDQRVEAGSELATSGSTGTPAAHLHIQFGTAATLINTKNGDAATATLIANGSLDSVAPAYFSKLLVRYVEGDPKDTSYYGTQGIDDFTGNSLANVVDGLDDNDILRGEAGGDTLRGGKGNDLLNGGTGADNLYGGIGDDIMIVDNASDKAFEALGQGTNDNVYATSSFTLAAGQEIEGLSANPQASTNPINLTGNEFRQVIRGNNGVNTILGGGGNDSLYGFGGSDTIESQAGNDSLFGGTGVDRFQFRQSHLGAASGIDRIYDFTAADYIKFDTASVTFERSLFSTEFALGTSALDASDRVIYDKVSGAMWFDADGTGAQAKILFAVLDTKPALSAVDILLF